MVESVAWITERKNVLSLGLYLSALLAYGRFTSFWTHPNENAPPERPQRRWGSYTLAFTLFTAAMLSKTTAFSFPAVILLICWWKRGTIRWRDDVLPTLPFFIVSIGFCTLTSWIEKNHVGAHGPDWAISFPARCLIAGRAFWFYVGKLLWPANLCFTYPRWQLDTASFSQWLYPISAIGALLILWLVRKRTGRAPLAAALFFVGTLFPSLGFMNAYFMRYSFVCDHWMYLSSLGLFALAAALITRLAAKLHAPESSFAFAAVALPIFAILTWRQCGIYLDLGTLWRDTLAKDPNSWLAQNNLGIMLRNEGKLAEAIAHYQEALRINPNYAETHNNYGVALKVSGHIDEAIAQYEEAIRLRPDYADAYDNLGNALRAQGRLTEAVEQYDQAIQLEPELTMAHYNLAIALKQQGKLDDAVAQYDQAIQLDPDFFEAHSNLAVILLQLGRIPEAVEHYDEAARLRPNSAWAHNDLALALCQAGRPRDAISQWELALQAKPDYPEAQSSLAWLLATLAPADGGDPPRAVVLAEQACGLTGYQIPGFVDTLAASYAAAGQFDDATVTAQKAVDLARAAGQSQLAGEIQARLQLYRNGQPYLQSSSPNRNQSVQAGSAQNP
jgi:protein O-mannosyl-transferase